jgi:hypothetical protein
MLRRSNQFEPRMASFRSARWEFIPLYASDLVVNGVSYGMQASIVQYLIDS